MERDRDFDRDERRRRSQQIDDPRASTRERYGNEEDPYSREGRRAYSEQDLPRRMHDDSVYNRPGYEPEIGQPGGRENVDLDRSRPQSSGRGQPERRAAGGYDVQWQRGQGGDPYGYDWEQPSRDRDRGQTGQPSQRHAFDSSRDEWQSEQADPFRSGQGQRGQSQRGQSQGGQGQRQGQQRFGQSGGGNSGGYSSGRPPSPYDQGEMSSWYGGDSGMGDGGSSLDQPSYPDAPRNAFGNQAGRGQQRQPMSQSQQAGQQGSATRQFGQQGYGQQGYGQHHDEQLDGPFSGRGPRGYQRSDERIREDVCELLTRHGGIDASSMEIDVKHGTVILRGMADSGRTRRLTEEVVEDVPGVRDVENQLRVNQRAGYSDVPGEMASGGTSGMTSSTTAGMTSSIGGSSSAGTSGTTPQTHGVSAYGIGVAETSGVSTRTGPGEPGRSAGAGASQHGNPWQIRETMDVVGSDGEKVGTVKMVRGTDFQVDRPMSRDLYVPFSAVRTVDGERVLLSCRASEVDQQNWPTPSLTGTTETPPAR